MDDSYDGKACIACGVWQPPGNFHRHTGNSDGRRNQCKTCIAERSRLHRTDNAAAIRAAGQAYYGANLSKVRRRLRRNALKRNYGLTSDQYDLIFSKQAGHCAICGSVDLRRLVVDHCHRTGVVRGLLCDPCNLGLARLREDPAIMDAAIRYLQRQRIS